ncbi:MAG: hypothetical protein KAX05_00145 [Bacteroidales bacterium]|nr:hypothetical protein [Bacteroidales bacterium]
MKNTLILYTADHGDMIDGRSKHVEKMLKLLEGKIPWRKILDMEHSKIYEKENAWVALTDGRYKYVYFTLTGTKQLFNLKTGGNYYD